MQIPSTYRTFAILPDGTEIAGLHSVWMSAARDDANRLASQHPTARVVVVTYNFTTLQDEVKYEVAPKAESAATADRTMYWFTKVYGLDFEGAHRLAEYESATDEFHAIRVLLLMAGSKCTFEEAVVAVAITDSDFDREELAEEITIKAGAFIVNQETGRTWQRPTPLTVTATRNQDSGCMEFNVGGNRFYVMEADDYEVAA